MANYYRKKMQEGGTTTDPDEGPTGGDALSKKLQEQVTATTLPTGQKIEVEKLEDAPDADTKITYDKLGDDPTATVTEAELGPDGTVAEPITPPSDSYTYTPTTTVGQVQDATAAQLTADEISDRTIVGDIQGTLSENAYAKAAQASVEEEQLVSFQLGNLYQSIQDGKPLPAWAAGAARAATSVMQQRGLGASSMAAAATVQAVMEAGLPIAAADAAEYSKINIANLNNRQQAVLQNANAVAAMDMANLDARMKAAVQNAQSFLSIDLQNLNNEQSTEVLNYQGQLQALFTDAAAENAAAQFNAKSQQQVDEFYAELGVQVDNANATRVAAMAQFNADQANSIATFNASIEDARERFDTQMQVQIDQSNASWRRQIATVDTAVQNEANRQNAMNLLQVSQSALSALWQRYRDESAWLMTTSESALQRAHQLSMLEFEKNANVEMFGMESEYATAASLGNAALAGILGMIAPGGGSNINLDGGDAQGSAAAGFDYFGDVDAQGAAAAEG